MAGYHQVGYLMAGIRERWGAIMRLSGRMTDFERRRSLWQGVQQSCV